MKIEILSSISESHDEFIELLNNSVENGASVGFLSPLDLVEAGRYWNGVSDELEAGVRTLIIVRESERLAGAVQLSYCLKKNGLHRAEVEKLMVHTDFRQQGIGKKLMTEIEIQAQIKKYKLLVLDTRTNDTASILYRKMGYVEAGFIPQFAKSSSGELDGTTFFYKLL